MFRDSVIALDAHVIGLQEVDRNMTRSGRVDMSGEAGNALNYEDFFAPARRRWDWGLYGNALLADGRIRQTDILRFPRRRFHYERRVAQLATVIVDDQTWNVANTHLSLRPNEHVLQLQEVATALSRRTGPRVLMGDFNMTPDAVRAAIEPLGWEVLESDFTFPSWAPDHTVDFICVQEARVEHVEVRSLEISDHAALIATLSPK
jgi:endonuclease/exonuclease/phosphatase family metal-dependent hydrolase